MSLTNFSEQHKVFQLFLCSLYLALLPLCSAPANSSLKDAQVMILFPQDFQPLLENTHVCKLLSSEFHFTKLSSELHVKGHFNNRFTMDNRSADTRNVATGGPKNKTRNNKSKRSPNENNQVILRNAQNTAIITKTSATNANMSSCSPTAPGLDSPAVSKTSNGHVNVANADADARKTSILHASGSTARGDELLTTDANCVNIPNVLSSVSQPVTSAPNASLSAEQKGAHSSGQEGSKKKQLPDKLSSSRVAVENASSESNPASLSAEAASGDQKPRSQQTKAERRAVQEAQRAAKAAGKPMQHPAKTNAPTDTKQQSAGNKQSTYASTTSIDTTSKQQPVTQKTAQKAVVTSKTPSAVNSTITVMTVRQSQGNAAAVESGGTFEIFSHLQKYQSSLPYDDRFIRPPKYPVHPAFIRLGALNAKRVVDGSNARCVALLYAFKQVICDYVTPPDKDLSRDLEARIKPYINFLTLCRPMSVSMGNAVRHVKQLITKSPSELTEQVAKEKLLDELDFFINEKILLAGEAISKTYAFEKINNGDNILTYAWSDLVTKVLCDAHRMGRRFSVTVVDSRPRTEGRETIRRLVENGIACSYVSITAVSYVMPEVSKVLLGAESLLANGYVMSHVGTSQLCLVAKAFNKPVLVCCETYKFCERVQTDSIVNNELGNPNDVPSASFNLSKFSTSGANAVQAEDAAAATVLSRAGVMQPTPYLSRLNLLFDVTPPDLITVVITEVGMVPCTSVPVVLRVKHVL